MTIWHLTHVQAAPINFGQNKFNKLNYIAFRPIPWAFEEKKINFVKLQSQVQTSVMGLGVDFVLPLSQQEQQQQQEAPLTKIYQKGVYLKAKIWHINQSWAFGWV